MHACYCMLNYAYKCCNIPPRPLGDEMKNSSRRRWRKKKKNFERMKRAEKKWKLRSKRAQKKEPDFCICDQGPSKLGGVSVDGKLGSEVVEDLVGKTGQAAGGGEGEVGGHEEVGEVFDRDFAGDGEVVAGRAGVLQDGLVGG